MQNVMQRLQGLDWPGLRESIQEKGYALTPEVLTAKQCRGLVELYGCDQGFRSHIVMQRYRFGRGEYKYFDYPLPPVVQEIRETCFPHLAPVANRWNEQLGAEERFPETHEAFLKSCRKQGQTRATAAAALRGRRLQLPAPGYLWRAGVSVADDVLSEPGGGRL